jgi:uncharacterized membrane protein
MAFCTHCGSEVVEGASFCPKCGASLSAPATGAPVTLPAAGTGLRENIAATLSYVLGWLTGIIFLLIDKRPFVRFHAAQSIVVFGGLNIIQILLNRAFWGGSYFGFFGLRALLSLLVSCLTLICWIVLMIQAYQGRRFEVPGAAGVAKNIAGSVSV